MAVRLFVGNLPYNATEAELREHFSAVGPVAGIWIATDRETGRPRGFAFVEYDDRAAAEEAVRRLNNKPFGGRPLAVNEARPQERGSVPQRRPGPPPGAGPRPGDTGGPGAGGFDGPARPRPPFRPQSPPDSGGGGFFSSEEIEPARRTRHATPPKKKPKERERGREFDKAREPKQPPIHVASGGRFLSSDDFEDADDGENDDFADLDELENAELEDAELDDESDDENDEHDALDEQNDAAASEPNKKEDERKDTA